jgi:methionyl-tRNA formyltransferase
VTIIRIEREMDAGDWCLMKRTPIGPEETAGELSTRLSNLAAQTLVEAVDQIARGEARFRPQPTEGVTLAPKVSRELGRLSFEEPVDRVLRRIRAVTPWPGADLELQPSGKRVRLLEAGPAEEAPGDRIPGTVRHGEGRIRIAALDGWIEVRRLQVPGRRAMDAAEFLRGARLAAHEEATSV